MKRLLCIVTTLLLVSFSLTSAGPHRKDAYRIKTVVIDAGHGGHDTGCLGSSAREKTVALNIALKLGKLIEQNFPDVKVIYTRKTDVFIPLHERANIANKAHADLFICIHLNSGAKSAYGAETYVMGLHKSDDNLNVAKRENAAILLEDDYKTQYDGFDPNSPEANIIFSLYQNQFMHQSLDFASKVQQQFEEYSGRNNRGVKQAGFLVLYKTAMPAVLIENGFLTHDMEEKFLDSEKGQSTMATAIFRAFKEYKIDSESSGGASAVKEDNQPKKDEPMAENPVKETPEPQAAPKQDTAPAQEAPKKEDPKPSSVNNPPTKEELPKQEPGKVIPPKEEKPAPEAEKPTPTPVKTEKAPVEKPEPATKKVYIGVQIGACTDVQKEDEKFKSVEGLKRIKGTDGYTRFVVGNYSSISAARTRQNQLKAEGFKDCFLTAYDGDKKITPLEAEQLLKRP